MENRAAVFTSQPQAVEVYQAGTWWSGELLGWRHDADGSCKVWVRVVLGGVEETAWTDLATLRLPERHLMVAAESPASVYAPASQEMSVARHPAGRRHRAAADDTATAGLPKVRDFTVVTSGPVAPSGGRRRAPEDVVEESAGGRRHAPEDTATTLSPAVAPAVPSPAGGRRRAPEDAVAGIPAPPSPLGRHRAPGDPGRHRTADTGLFPVVAGESAPPTQVQAAVGHPIADRRRAAPAPRAPRPEGSRDGWSAPEGLEAELLTRPMRLSDHAPHSGRPRLDGSLRSV
ncbi:MAG TPA: hypothetical protein VK402_10470 [Blastococcus sp.]|nr:hypothetical protein [Blastococcus sp.]